MNTIMSYQYACQKRDASLLLAIFVLNTDAQPACHFLFKCQRLLFEAVYVCFHLHVLYVLYI